MKKLFLILALMVCATAQAITPLQAKAQPNSTTLTFASNVGAYHLIGAYITKGDNTVSCSSVTDSLGLAYTKRLHVTQASANMMHEWWDAQTGTASGADTLTFNCTGGTAVDSAAIEYPGMALSAVFDQVANSQGDFTNPLDSGNTPSTTQASELVIGVGDQSPVAALTAGTGYTLEVEDHTFHGYGIEDKTVSSTGAQDAQMNGASGHWIISVVTYKVFVPGGTALLSGNLKLSGNLTISSSSSPILNYSFRSYDFTSNYGPFIQGDTYTTSPAILTLTDVGSVAVTITAISFSNADYTQTNTCGALPATLAAGASCKVNIVFAPTCGGSCTSTPAADNATLTITDSSDVGTQSVALTGQGVSNAGAVLLADTFSTGDFSKWSVSSGFPSDNPFIENTITYNGAAHSYGQRYESACCVAGDTNRWIAAILAAQTEVWVRGYVYIKTPEADATPPLSSLNPRKLIEYGDSNSGSSCCGNWTSLIGVLNGTQGAATSNLYLAYNGVPCGQPVVQAYDLATFNFSSFHEVQLHTKLDSGGLQNGAIDVYLDGANVYHNGAAYIRGTCTGQITGFFVGRQTDSPANTTMDEYRYWDNIRISTAYNGQ